MVLHKNLKTWVEINRQAVEHNVALFKERIGKTKLMAVVKSNAYGHGITTFPKLADKLGVHGFCVDSVYEGKTLRLEGIRKPILVLGYTLPELFPLAARYNLAVTISTFEGLKAIGKIKRKSLDLAQDKPRVHLKIDTGMHRQGFSKKDIRNVIREIKKNEIPVEGIYTHFASAKDVNYPTYTETQLKNFKAIEELFKKAGFKNLIRHVAATGGTLLNKKYHYDWVRVGVGLYGLWPSKELEIQLGNETMLKPVLSWRAVVSEVKQLKKGEYSGYDMAYRARRNQTIAVIPIGYWHGIPRSYGGGKVLVRGKEAPIVGRISMDVTIVDVSGIPCKVGDIATIVGKNASKEVSAFDAAREMGTIHYEFLTRLNPLMERVVV